MVVSLEAIQRGDLEKFRQWRNSPQLNKYFRQYKKLTERDQEDWYNSLHDNGNLIMFLIAENGKAIGVCGLTNINWKDRVAEISIYIGNVYVDDRAVEALYLLRDYAFDTLDLYRLYAEVYEFDTMKYELLIQAGFSKEGAFREHVFHDGERHDSILLGINK